MSRSPRADEIVETLQKRPGLTARELAAAIGRTTNDAREDLRRCRQAGRVFGGYVNGERVLRFFVESRP